MNKNNIDFAGSYVALGKCVGKTKYIVFGKEYTEEEVKSIFEKATSKKPIEQRTWTYDEIPYTALCPTCKENLGYESKRLYKHCPYCGQRIDWSGEDVD